ncbi:MAG TPA: DUF3500 domain-containing protein [Puia sp.]|jgi:hypothetical protein|nr:DUF3500 domain-containing protein [Puia sp.]
MKRNYILFAGIAFAGLYCICFAWIKPIHQGTPEEQTRLIVKATNDFLQSLNEGQRAKILFAFTPQKVATGVKFQFDGNGGGPGRRDSSIRPPNGNPPGSPPRGGQGKGPGGSAGEKYGDAVWSNFPVTFVKRPGLNLGSLNATQRKGAMQLLKALLSPAGFTKIEEIMGSDQVLADSGADFSAGNDSYLLAIFGKPNPDSPWMVEFGGHHLALNIVIAGSEGALTPTLTGAQPSVYQASGKTVRVLAAENDKAFDLLNALDPDQLKKAILNYEVGDLVLGPGHDGEVMVSEGLKASEMTAKQKEMLTDLIAQWAGIINTAYAKARMQEIREGINETYFAWSGPTTHAPNKNGSSYYRIQGPRVIIEFSPQGLGGDLTMHVHTIYRDPLNNYGNGFRK